MASLSRKRVDDTPAIPDRLYFKIGDVARLCGVEPYVLRFWETQFPQLKPNKSGTGQRLYRRREVELAVEIKRLVHGEGYTLSGARHALEGGPRRVEAKAAAQEQAEAPVATGTDARKDALKATVGRVKAELREIAAMLAASQPKPTRHRPRVVTLSSDSGNLFPL
jgi:DNA-binding transcriptional MerR regulator